MRTESDIDQEHPAQAQEGTQETRTPEIQGSGRPVRVLVLDGPHRGTLQTILLSQRVLDQIAKLELQGPQDLPEQRIALEQSQQAFEERLRRLLELDEITPPAAVESLPKPERPAWVSPYGPTRGKRR